MTFHIHHSHGRTNTMGELLIKIGVAGFSLQGLNPLLWECLTILTNLWEATPLIVTSTCEGTHLPCSYHYSGDAIDLRKPIGHTPAFYREIINRLPTDVKFLDEGTHYHLQTLKRRIHHASK